MVKEITRDEYHKQYGERHLLSDMELVHLVEANNRPGAPNRVNAILVQKVFFPEQRTFAFETDLLTLQQKLLGFYRDLAPTPEAEILRALERVVKLLGPG